MRAEDLSDLIVRAHAIHGQDFPRKDAVDLAWTVLQFFGYGDQCLGNALEQQERTIFYELEDLGILKSVSREDHLHTGDIWRTLTWEFDREGIRRIGSFSGSPQATEVEQLYASLPAEAFSRAQRGAAEQAMEEPEMEKAIEVQTGSESDGEVSYKICNICGIYARSKAAMMRHYREKHPLDENKLQELRKQGKTVEEMAVMLERTPSTIRYHLDRIDRKDAVVVDLTASPNPDPPDNPPEMEPAHHPAERPESSAQVAILTSEIADLVQQLNEARDELKERERRIAELESPPQGRLVSSAFVSDFSGFYDNRRKLISDMISAEIHQGGKGKEISYEVREFAAYRTITIRIQEAPGK